VEFDGIDWDESNTGKCEKHGVSVQEIERLFQGEILVAPDPTHSIDERRYRAVGVTAAGRSVFVVFAWRWRRRIALIRPISARYMHKKEVLAYEKEISDLQIRRRG
jgi:uncharacterized DUF497 family protein